MKNSEIKTKIRNKMTQPKQRPAEIMPETEKLVADWAKYHKYVAKPRIWRQDRIREVQTAHELGYVEGIKVKKIEGDVKKLARLEQELTSAETYTRNIYVPSGLVLYAFYDSSEFFPEKRIDTEEQLERLLESGECYNFALEWHLGERLKNWQSDKCTEAERKTKATLSDSVVISSDGVIVDGEEMTDGKTALKRLAETLKYIQTKIREVR